MATTSRTLGALGLLLLAAGPLAAASARVPGVRSGLVEVAPDRVSLAERVTFHRETGPRLAALAVEESADVADWPVAPGERRTVRFTRRDIYAPDARVLVARGDRLEDAPRSTLVFLRGAVEGESGGNVAAWVDPETGALAGVSVTRFGTHELRPTPARAREGLVGAPASFSDSPLVYACNQEELPPAPDEPGAAGNGAGEGAAAGSGLAAAPLASTAATRQIVIAFDTDNELMSLKFSDNTTNATNYVAALVAAMTPIYERDLSVRIVQGTLILRPSSSADPYSVNPGGNANTAYLTEFSNYWSANYASTTRGLAQLLSGKQPNSYSASGIAWRSDTTLCSSTYGYSVAQVFKFPGSNASHDTYVNAHEIGHNFGSPHTHCPWDATPAIDYCYNAQGGCYAGATSCPAAATYQGVPNVTGTLMSYCHTLSGCTAGLVFHPTTISKLDTIMTGKSCLTSIAPAPSAARLYTVTPCRVLDTRNANGALGGPILAGGGAQRSFTASGVCGIPSGAVALSANVTVTSPSADGSLRLFPTGTSAPTSTVISFPAGTTRANNAHVLLSTGAFTVQSDGGATHLIVDVNGYYQ